MKFVIITQHQVYDPNRDWDTDDYAIALVSEQDTKANLLGINGNVLCHFFDSPFFDEQTTDMHLEDAIQCLAIKDGVDMVQYENGNYGFVAYYNGIENGFEIIG